MMVTCPACTAKYTIDAGRLDGRRAKFRCKRCGETFTVDPSTPSAQVYARQKASRRARDVDLYADADADAGADATAPPLTGERGEDSVLFSLATLSKPAPAPSPPSTTESSALIDLRAMVTPPPKDETTAPSSDSIANLGGGEAFASLFTPPLAPPVTFAPAQDDVPAHRRHVPIVIAATTLVILGIAGLVGVHSQSRTVSATAVIRAKAVRVPANAPSPTSSTAAVPPSEAPAASMSAGRPSAPARAARAHEAGTSAPVPATSTPSTATKCCPGESEIDCRMRISTGAKCAVPRTSTNTPPPPFDRYAAARALAIDVAKCKHGESPRGPGHVRVTFQPNGSVSAVAIDAPYAGTATGACVADRYRRVSVPAFSGDAIMVGKSFVIE